MADNTKAKVKIGETVSLKATLKDTDEDTGLLVPLSLTGYLSVRMTAVNGSTVMLDEVPCTILPLQDTTDKGKVVCTIEATVDNYPNLRDGTCKLEFKAVDSGGGIHYFPKRDRKYTYGTIEFQEPLS
jgi:hypothetical protein